LSEDVLQERIRSATVVVVGRVRQVREPTGAAFPSTGGRRPISEHDPHMAEALIEVTDGIKGAAAGSEIVVRFPASNEVAWFSYPKFRAGRYRCLHAAARCADRRRHGAGRRTEVPVFNAPRVMILLPLTDVDRVRNLAR